MKILNSLVIILLVGFSLCAKDEIMDLGSARLVTTNEVDNLNIAVDGMDNVADSKTYTYATTSPNTELSVAGMLSGGSIGITIKNSTGVTVHNKTYQNMVADYTVLTHVGNSWTFEMVANSASGRFSLILVNS
jgi:hypothetical protein